MERRRLLRYGIACTAALALPPVMLSTPAGAAGHSTGSSAAMRSALTKALRTIGTAACHSAADELQRQTDGARAFVFHVRNAGIDSDGASIIAGALTSVSTQEASSLASFSLSYNDALGDSGAIALADALPLSLPELGLVGCDVADAGGTALLEWARQATRQANGLRMICIEDNRFSDRLKSQFRSLPGITTYV